MPSNTRSLKRRIVSVKNTRKITKAMEMVAASKMRRAVSGVLGTRPYTTLAWETVQAIAVATDPSTHPLLVKRKQVKRILFILYTSDRGLCGGFNTRMIKEALKSIGRYHEAQVDIVAVGKRGAQAVRRGHKQIVAAFEQLTNNPKFVDTLPISKLLLQSYLDGTYDKVVIGYTDYVSAVTQIPRVTELLPLKQEIGTGPSIEYTFEPSPAAVLDFILPRIVETMIWQALLETAASEHAARMLAMHSATDAAKDMIDDLTFTYNQIRQAGITREIAEISSGKAALE